MEIRTGYETARKTFFWYRVYCAVLVVLYLAVTVFGIVLTTVPMETRRYEQDELVLMGFIYAILGAIFFVVFAVAFFLPPKPYNWIVGIVMLAIGMTSAVSCRRSCPFLFIGSSLKPRRFSDVNNLHEKAFICSRSLYRYDHQYLCPDR